MVYILILSSTDFPRVFQMSLLEMDNDVRGTPQGVVLALVGPEVESPSSSKDLESTRVLRMYNLTSLISLAKWAVAQKVSIFIV